MVCQSAVTAWNWASWKRRRNQEIFGDAHVHHIGTAEKWHACIGIAIGIGSSTWESMLHAMQYTYKTIYFGFCGPPSKTFCSFSAHLLYISIWPCVFINLSKSKFSKISKDAPNEHAKVKKQKMNGQWACRKSRKGTLSGPQNFSSYHNTSSLYRKREIWSRDWNQGPKLADLTGTKFSRIWRTRTKVR